MLNTVYLQYLTLGYFYFFIFILLLNNFITFYFMERLNNVIHDNLFPTKKWWNHIICSSSKFYIIELRDVNLEHVKQDSLYKEKYSVMQYWKKKNSEIFRQTYMYYWNTLNFLFTSFRMIQQSFIDMENMFELLDESHEVIYCISDLMIWKTG